MRAGHDKNIDSRMFWLQFCAACSFAGRVDSADSAAARALRLLAWGAGDSDTNCSILGLIVGAYTGRVGRRAGHCHSRWSASLPSGGVEMTALCCTSKCKA